MSVRFFLMMLALAGSAFGTNLLVNGDFETTDGRTGLVFGSSLSGLGVGAVGCVQ